MPLKPDPTFYPSPASAMEGPPEELAYVVTLNTPSNGDARPDALTTVDVKPGSSTYGTVVGRLDMPNVGDELHHFGWNACSSALCPWAPHPHVERRYLLVPGLRSSRIHVVDVKDGGKRVLTIRKGEGEPFTASVGTVVNPGASVEQQARLVIIMDPPHEGRALVRTSGVEVRASIQQQAHHGRIGIAGSQHQAKALRVVGGNHPAGEQGLQQVLLALECSLQAVIC